MLKQHYFLAFVLAISPALAFADAPPKTTDAEAAKAKALAAKLESELISDTHQITFEGRRAGEGYFSADGRRMVFQSERDPANPFYQIYVTDLETGDIEKVSPGYGKTTCAWIHPDRNRILFAWHEKAVDDIHEWCVDGANKIYQTWIRKHGLADV